MKAMQGFHGRDRAHLRSVSGIPHGRGGRYRRDVAARHVHSMQRRAPWSWTVW